MRKQRCAWKNCGKTNRVSHWTLSLFLWWAYQSLECLHCVFVKTTRKLLHRVFHRQKIQWFFSFRCAVQTFHPRDELKYLIRTFFDIIYGLSWHIEFFPNSWTRCSFLYFIEDFDFFRQIKNNAAAFLFRTYCDFHFDGDCAQFDKWLIEWTDFASSSQCAE